MKPSTGKQVATGRRTAAGSLAIVIAALLVLSACGSTGGQDATQSRGSVVGTAERPDHVASAARQPGYVFNDLATLVATSDYVVRGTIRSATKGELVVPDDYLYHRDLEVQVESQYYGPKLPSTIFVHQDG